MARRRILSALGFYGALAAAALGVLLLGDRPMGNHPSPWMPQDQLVRLGVSLALGLAVVAVGIASTRLLVKRTRWAKELHVGFRGLLGPLSSAEITVFALTSGIAEELFFRGALQPWIGLAAASVVFGAVHLGPGRRFLPWTVWAMVMGLVLGAVYELTGEILGPIVAHVLINYENLHFVNTHNPAGDADASHSRPAGLVGARERGGGSRSWH